VEVSSRRCGCAATPRTQTHGERDMHAMRVKVALFAEQQPQISAQTCASYYYLLTYMTCDISIH
jgi:hypothetical protein